MISSMTVLPVYATLNSNLYYLREYWNKFMLDKKYLVLFHYYFIIPLIYVLVMFVKTQPQTDQSYQNYILMR